MTTNRKKTPMFESSVPTAYEFVDFTSPANSTGLSKLGMKATEMKSSQVLNDSIT